MHSGGGRLEVGLSYAENLTMRVFDNGIGKLRSGDGSIWAGGQYGLIKLDSRSCSEHRLLYVQEACGGWHAIPKEHGLASFSL
jgi:hypothetical protein